MWFSNRYCNWAGKSTCKQQHAFNIKRQRVPSKRQSTSGRHLGTIISKMKVKYNNMWVVLCARCSVFRARFLSIFMWSFYFILFFLIHVFLIFSDSWIISDFCVGLCAFVKMCNYSWKKDGYCGSSSWSFSCWWYFFMIINVV